MQGTNRILVLRLRGGCCSQVEQPFWKSLFLLSWFRLEPLSYGGGCDDPAPMVAGRATCLCLCQCLCITDAPQVWPARSLLGTPGSATIRAPPTDFMGDSERERSRGNLAPYCSSWAMIIAPYLLRYNIPSTALACIHTLQPY